MVSENIQALREFWIEFKSQAVFNIKDLEKLQEKFAHAYETIKQLEESRDSWKKKYFELKAKV